MIDAFLIKHDFKKLEVAELYEKTPSKKRRVQCEVAEVSELIETDIDAIKAGFRTSQLVITSFVEL